MDASWERTPTSGNWDKVKDPAFEERCMEVYAAMVDSMDQGIGRIVGELRDVVFTHLDGAGSANGAGGADPTAPGERCKNFRYACWATPATPDTAANYLNRRGRFPKNWQNFHPNPDHNASVGDITGQLYGPDICFYRLARGLSSNASFNSTQGIDHMRYGMRGWAVWLRQQTGVDGSSGRGQALRDVGRPCCRL